MKKVGLAGIVGLLVLLFSGTAFANLDDNRAAMAQKYGDYRLVIDTDNQLWTRADWEAKGHLRAKASSYMYSFERQGLVVQMEVMYNGDAPASLVRAQRFTPATSVKISDFKKYFPEVFNLAVTPKAIAFTSYDEITRNFQEPQSPVRMGIVVKAAGKGSYSTLLAFNILDEGRLVKDVRYINQETMVREFTIESISPMRVNDNLNPQTGEWQPLTNYFTGRN